MKPGRWIAVGLFVLLVGYLFFWPVPIDPAVWTPPPAPELKSNDALARVERLAEGAGVGPEATAIDGEGRVYTGLEDGRVIRIDAAGKADTFANTGGRPMGMTFDAAGNLIVADAERGLLSISPAAQISTLATEHGGVRFGFTDDVDVAADGTLYFSDATHRFSVHDYRNDAMEHRPNGRLLAYHPAEKRTELLADGLYFANGVALGPDDAYVLVNESWEYRTTRVWLTGPKKGQREPFIESLPGFPDNLTYSDGRRLFWVALFAPRNPSLDGLAGSPFLRKLVLRLPLFLQPAPARHAIVLGIDENGKIVHDLQHAAPDSYSPITSVREHGGWLYLGSFSRESVARARAP